MSPSRRRDCSALLATVVVLTAGTAARADDTYPVKIDRPMAGGQSFAITAKADVTQSETTKDGGHTRTDTYTFTADLAGTMTVDAVAARTGTPTKVTVALDHLVKDDKDLVPPGTVVTADRTGPAPVYTAGGKPLDPAAAAALAVLLDVDKPDRTLTDDDMAGTARPQPVGGTWAGRPEQLGTALADDGLPFGAGDLKVDGKLVEAKPVNGTPAVVVVTTLSADGSKAARTLPNGITFVGGALRGTNTYTLPIDPAMPVAVVEQHSTITVKTSGPGSASGRATDERTVEQTLRRTLTPKADRAPAATRPAR